MLIFASALKGLAGRGRAFARKLPRAASHARVCRLLLMAAVTALPVILNRQLWREVWFGERAWGWDGTGHFALSQIYDRLIFPDTFGWTQSYFAGMPFPNFYPPLFYWCVSLLHHTGLLNFAAAFKLVLVLPVLALPLTLWLLAWALTEKSHAAGFVAAAATIPLLIDARLKANFSAGLNYHGTFQVGLYTQTLGFVLLSAWLVVYLGASRSGRRYAAACVLLALTALASFFNAITAAIFVGAVLTHDLVRYFKVKQTPESARAWRTFLAHLTSPLVAAGLCMFWVVPMLGQYKFFVTRPHVVPLHQMIPPSMLGWYALAAAGLLCWMIKPTRWMWPFLWTCAALGSVVIFASTLAPPWFPLQAPRFIATLNFLLAVPIGVLARTALQLANATGRRRFLRAGLGHAPEDMLAPAPAMPMRNVFVALAGLAALALVAVYIKPMTYKPAFLPANYEAGIDGVLRFAQGHREGRYLVEVPYPPNSDTAFEGRALNSYLGAQGNETLNVVFHESSPSAIFFTPLANAFSSGADSFGISSVLADDTDFAAQSLSRHLERARFLGVRYVVINTGWMKNRLSQERATGTRYDIGDWTVFEMREQPDENVRALDYKPALVVGNLSVKERRRDQYDFVRLAEEQFAAGSFDVLLARSPVSEIDRLEGLEDFGSLILDTYECRDEDAAFARLREFARHEGRLILLSAEAPLFKRLKGSLSEFPRAVVVERQPEISQEVIRALEPEFSYAESSVRREWGEVYAVLDAGKVPANAGVVSGGADGDALKINLAGQTQTGRVPVLLKTTFHPNWRRSDSGAVYVTTPFFMLTFVDAPATRLVYQRRWYEQVGFVISSLALLLCCLCWQGERVLRRRRAKARAGSGVYACPVV
ncbi:MAG TPA: hypothetical protein VF634_11365, partial [Pyrinomonadaceae bacterium]